jgi:repressor LexA
VITDDPRARLAALVAEHGQSYEALSRMLRRNAAYLQQYVKRGTPRELAEGDRRVLAAFFRVPETELGGMAAEITTTAVRRLEIEASAGPGALADEDRASGAVHFDARLLAQLGVRPQDAAEIRARGTSMAPLIEDGDLMLVDERDRRVRDQSAVYVIRLDGALMVKRVARSGTMLHVTSDNPEAPPIAPQTPHALEIIGRVVWLSRALR